MALKYKDSPNFPTHDQLKSFNRFVSVQYPQHLGIVRKTPYNSYKHRHFQHYSNILTLKNKPPRYMITFYYYYTDLLLLQYTIT